jgi:hypothetical protein
MTELHWSERRRLERMKEAKERPEQEQIIKATNITEAIDLIVQLIEHQRWRYAQIALQDTSKYPQRIQGCAEAFDALLEYDLYPIQQRLKAQ